MVGSVLFCVAVVAVVLHFDSHFRWRGNILTIGTPIHKVYDVVRLRRIGTL